MSKLTKVTVVGHPTTGAIITPRKNNPEYGVIRVDQSRTSMENGFVNTSNRTAWLGGKITDLEGLGLKAGSTLPGQIVRKEAFAPFYEGQSPKINPQTDEVILKDGKEVYMQDVYTDDANAPSYSFVAEEVLVEETATAGQEI